MIHKDLAIRWQKMSLSEQMGNIGSEFHRTLKDKEAVWRLLELLDLTISDKHHRNKLTELTRLREAICDYFLGNNQYKINPQNLEDYFLYFACQNIKMM